MTKETPGSSQEITCVPRDRMGREALLSAAVRTNPLADGDRIDITKYTQCDKERYLRAKRQTGTRGAPRGALERLSSHQSGDRRGIDADSSGGTDSTLLGDPLKCNWRVLV